MANTDVSGQLAQERRQRVLEIDWPKPLPCDRARNDACLSLLGRVGFIEVELAFVLGQQLDRGPWIRLVEQVARPRVDALELVDCGVGVLHGQRTHGTQAIRPQRCGTSGSVVVGAFMRGLVRR